MVARFAPAYGRSYPLCADSVAGWEKAKTFGSGIPTVPGPRWQPRWGDHPGPGYALKARTGQGCHRGGSEKVIGLLQIEGPLTLKDEGGKPWGLCQEARHRATQLRG